MFSYLCHGPSEQRHGYGAQRRARQRPLLPPPMQDRPRTLSPPRGARSASHQSAPARGRERLACRTAPAIRAGQPGSERSRGGHGVLCDEQPCRCHPPRPLQNHPSPPCASISITPSMLRCCSRRQSHRSHRQSRAAGCTGHHGHAATGQPREARADSHTHACHAAPCNVTFSTTHRNHALCSGVSCTTANSMQALASAPWHGR